MQPDVWTSCSQMLHLMLIPTIGGGMQMKKKWIFLCLRTNGPHLNQATIMLNVGLQDTVLNVVALVSLRS